MTVCKRECLWVTYNNPRSTLHDSRGKFVKAGGKALIAKAKIPGLLANQTPPPEGESWVEYEICEEQEHGEFDSRTHGEKSLVVKRPRGRPPKKAKADAKADAKAEATA